MKGLLGFASKRLGVKLYPGQREVLRDAISSRRRKWVLCLGRRSGKGLMTAVAAIYNATAEDYSGLLRRGETRFVVVVATRQEQAREFIRVVRELLVAAPDRDLAALVDTATSTQDEIHFKTGVVIRAMPCSSRSTRGLPVSLLVMDEVGHFMSTDLGYQAGKRVYEALAPGTAQFGARGYILLTSTPNWRQGIFWDLYKAGTEGLAEDIHVVQRPTWEMVPSITRASLESEFRSDPDMARREYGAEFSAAAGAYLEPAEVLACVRKGRRTLAPVQTLSYSAALDPAYSHDAFSMCVVNRDSEGLVVVDGVWGWTRGGHEATLDNVAAIAKSYNINTVRTDQNATVPVTEGLARRGIGVNYVAWDNQGKADCFARVKVLINTGAIELPDDDRLIRELLNLEVRPTPSGKPKIAAAGSGHDDLACALAGAVAQLSVTWSPGTADKWRELINDLKTPGGGASKYDDLIRGGGPVRMPLDRLDR